MRMTVMSDVHLEFGALIPENTHNTDVLILAGDICVASHFLPHKINDWTEQINHYNDFFAACNRQWERVYYVMGNHEHYYGDLYETEYYLRRFLNKYENIKILERKSDEFEGVVFVGATIWTDFNKYDPYTVMTCEQGMNDFVLIQTPNGRLTAEDVFVEHHKALDFIKKTCNDNANKPIVVIGHHAPSTLSVKPKYDKDHVINGAYRSDLSEIMLDNINIKYWFHGHTHDNFDYTIGETRVICNPRGYYGHSLNGSFEPTAVYEL